MAAQAIGPGSPTTHDGDPIHCSAIDLPTLKRAWRLAFFLLRDKTLALEVTAAALARVGCMIARQDRRSAYTPKTHRNKVFLSSAQLLQGLIYRESEAHERRQEMAASVGAVKLGAEELLVRYIEHLIRISLWRNSFYVTLALCKFLYRYRTEEIMAIYDLVTQDPERRRDDPYYRARKAVLLREIEARFGPLISRCRGHRGESQLRCREASGSQVELIHTCLSRFTPWQTHCMVPGDLDLWGEALPALCLPSEAGDRGSCIEVNRIHAVLHPVCFSRLTRSLGLDPPERRLAIPRFFPDRQG